MELKKIQLATEYEYNGCLYKELEIKKPKGKDINKVDMLAIVRCIDFTKAIELQNKAAAAGTLEEKLLIMSGITEFLNIKPEALQAFTKLSAIVTNTSMDFIDELYFDDQYLVFFEVGKFMGPAFFRLLTSIN